MKIKVTQEHIDNGVAQSCSRCPVALALLDAGFEKVSVGFVGIFCLKDGELHRAELPQKVKAFIRRVDAHDRVKPMEFEL